MPAALCAEWQNDVGVLEVSDSQFISCFSGTNSDESFYTGAIYVYDGLVTMERVSATQCVASLDAYGIGSFLQMWCESGFTDSHLIADCTICQCQAYDSSIYFFMCSAAICSGVNFSESTTSSVGFTIHLALTASSETVTLNSLVVVNCSGETGLQTSYLEDCTLLCTNCIFVRNEAKGKGPALFGGTEGTWDISGCLFEDNSGTFMRGLNKVTVTVTNCVFFGELPEGVSEASGNSITSDRIAISFAPCLNPGVSESLVGSTGGIATSEGIGSAASTSDSSEKTTYAVSDAKSKTNSKEEPVVISNSNSYSTISHTEGGRTKSASGMDKATSGGVTAEITLGDGGRDSGLGRGVIAGIAVGSVVIVGAVCGVLGYFIVRKKNGKKYDGEVESESLSYDSSKDTGKLEGQRPNEEIKNAEGQETGGTENETLPEAL
jgi:hypothetical protein